MGVFTCLIILSSFNIDATATIFECVTCYFCSRYMDGNPFCLSSVSILITVIALRSALNKVMYLVLVALRSIIVCI